MIVRSIDGDNDWQFGKGRNDYQKNNNAISQNIKTRLQSFLGDCFFAINDGLDWFNLLGSKNAIAIELAARATILNTEGVTAILTADLVTNPFTRQITLTYRVSTVYTGGANGAVLSGSTAFLLTQSGDILTTEDGDAISVI